MGRGTGMTAGDALGGQAFPGFNLGRAGECQGQDSAPRPCGRRLSGRTSVSTSVGGTIFACLRSMGREGSLRRALRETG